MPKYCSRCMLSFDGEICPACGSKRVKEAEPGDLCFLTEKDRIWAGVLADVLKQNGIPFLHKSSIGAGMAIRTGPMFETVRFYVCHEQLEKSAEIVNELFSKDGETVGGEDDSE